MCLVYNRCIIYCSEVTASRKKRFLLFLTPLSPGVFRKNTITISKSDNTFSNKYLELKSFLGAYVQHNGWQFIQQWI